MPEETSRFTPGVAGWTRGLGRLRDAVRQELVRRQVAAIVRPGDRVLDAGCGQGTQALHLARAGHEVVGLDASDELLARFEADLAGEATVVRRRVGLVRGRIEDVGDLALGRFDLLLCHGVLMYADAPAALLFALSGVAGPDARLSLLVRNGLAPAMRPGLLGQYADARRAFDSSDYVNRLGLAAHTHTPDQVDALLGPGWRRERWWGVRVFSDHLEDGEVTADLLAAEDEAAGRDPYRQVAALLHLVHTAV